MTPTPPSSPHDTPTPRTDAVKVSVCLNWDNTGDYHKEVVPADFARTLERELTAANERASVAAQVGRELEIDGLRAEVARLAAELAVAARERDEAQRPWRVELAFPSNTDPFERADCKVIDTGYAERILIVECEEVAKQEQRLTAANAALEKEVEELIWNLAGCDTIASGWGKPFDYDKSAARPALDTVSRMAEREADLRTLLTEAEGALEEALALDEVDRDLRLRALLTKLRGVDPRAGTRVAAPKATGEA